MMERDYHDATSSYDEILDFDTAYFEEDGDEETYDEEGEPYFRSIDEY